MSAVENGDDNLSDLGIPCGELHVAAFINKHFPDEPALEAGIDPFLSRLGDAITGMDAQLAALVRSHRHSGSTAERCVSGSLASLDILSAALDELSAASSVAEAAAREALAPARSFSIALDNSSKTAVALDALVTLNDGIANLEIAAQSGDLSLVSRDPELYPRVCTALAVFAAEKASGPGLKRLPELRTRAHAASESLRQTILSDFRQLSDVITLAAAAGGSASANYAATSTIATAADTIRLKEANGRLCTACAVAALIGHHVTDEVVGAHIRSRMAAFRAAFEMDKDGLTGIDKRFGWVRRELRSNWARLGGERRADRGWAAIFPESWDVAWRLSSAAMRELRSWVCTTLDAGADHDVVSMVRALSKSKEFEAELDRWFARAKRPPETPLDRPETGNDDSRDAALAEQEQNRRAFTSTLSTCFGPYMGSYVAQEDEHLRIAVVDLLTAETWACADGSVLRSSTDLFLAIKKSMRMCVALDSRQPLFSLYKVFRKHLNAYAVELVRRIPAPVRADISPSGSQHLPDTGNGSINVGGNNGSNSGNGVKNGNRTDGSSTTASIDSPEVTTRVDLACAVITTAEYCASTVEMLEESLRETVEEVFAPEVSLAKERERFETASAKGLRSLVAVVSADLEGTLSAISREKWGSWSAIGDSSPYVGEVDGKLRAIMPVLGNKLAKPHMRFFLERFAASLIPRYIDFLYGCTVINHTGAQQLLLDAAALKGILLGMPALAHAPAPPTFSKYTNRELGKAEAMLKVVLSPGEMSVDAYTTLVPDGSAADLQRILEIKQMSRASSAGLLLEYTRLVGPQRGLQTSMSGSRDGTGELRSQGPFSSLSRSGPGRGEVGNQPETQQQVQTQAAQAQVAGAAAAEAATESVRALWGRIGSSWGSLKDVGIADRIGETAGRINESLGETAEVMKRRFGQ
jgi:vacuolar protein sorting-associated protein 53